MYMHVYIRLSKVMYSCRRSLDRRSSFSPSLLPFFRNFLRISHSRSWCVETIWSPVNSNTDWRKSVSQKMQLHLHSKLLEVLVVRNIFLHRLSNNICPLLSKLANPFRIQLIIRLGRLFLFAESNVSIRVPKTLVKANQLTCALGFRSVE